MLASVDNGGSRIATHGSVGHNAFALVISRRLCPVMVDSAIDGPLSTRNMCAGNDIKSARPLRTSPTPGSAIRQTFLCRLFRTCSRNRLPRPARQAWGTHPHHFHSAVSRTVRPLRMRTTSWPTSRHHRNSCALSLTTM
jgi:hypothetical protein